MQGICLFFLLTCYVVSSFRYFGRYERRRLLVEMAAARVEVYSTIGCKYCRIAKAKLDELGVEYINYDVQGGGDLERRATDRVNFALSKTVPQIYIEDDYIGGATDLLDKIETGSFFEMLRKNGIDLKPSTNRSTNRSTKDAVDAEAILAFKVKYSSKEALNGGITLSEKITKYESCLALSEEMQQQALILTDKFVTSDGKLVDYDRLIQSSDFERYVLLSIELQSCPISELQGMNYREKFSFFANLYNAMIIHALCVLGAPADTPAARSAFYSGRSGAKYIIGGYSWGPDDIEHGILRSNYPHPSQLASDQSLSRHNATYFNSNDPRSLIAIDKKNFDPRIHFVLNCGARSCPPIKIIDPVNLEAAMLGAARAYLAAELHVDESCRVITLPKLLLWYGSDFGDDMVTRLTSVVDMLPIEKGGNKEKIQEAIDSMVYSGEEYTVEYGEYEWATNSGS